MVAIRRHRSFETARRDVVAIPFALIVTNLRLAAFNGLHLVHLAATAGLPTRAVVYTDEYDALIGREVQRAGAFYETRACLEMALPAYVRGALPPEDRRNPAIRERRLEYRGGRRSWDRPLSRRALPA
jgi:hypothetical protein